MYYVEAKYQNMENGEEHTETITVEIYEDMTEFDAYIAAMCRAYKMKKPEQCLCAVEFVAC